MHKVTIYVSIGRNVGNKPMEDGLWTNFKYLVFDTLGQLTNIISETQGTGTYGRVVEDTAVWIAEANTDILPSLKRTLTALGEHYGQEAIGFAAVENSLLSCIVTASPDCN